MTEKNAEFSFRNVEVMLAPMAGVTDRAMRQICGEHGAQYAVTEMVSAKALVYEQLGHPSAPVKTADLCRIDPGIPTAVQIFGSEPEHMAEAARLISNSTYRGFSGVRPAAIDINMGCPVKKIVSSGDGSALMSDLPLAERIVSAVKEVCARHGVLLGVKFRLGKDDSSINAPDFAVGMAKSGADVLTLHCRTRAQMYMPSARREYCREVKNALTGSGFSSVTLIGNGDVESRADAEEYLALGCDGVAVGRAALSNPWLFSEIAAPETFVPPSIDERVELIREYITAVVGEMGEVRGIRESRSRAAYLLHGVRGGAKVRDALNRAETLTRFLAELERVRG